MKNLSIIVPALNEENYLPKLLRSIKKQKFRDGEIIVADAGSKDKTLEIAKKFGCKIVKGGLPAKGRNEGAKTAKGDLLLFLDADVILPRDFLKRALREIQRRKLAVASPALEPRTEKKIIKFLFKYFNAHIKRLEKFLPYGAMGIFIEKSIHQKIKGFDEKLKIAEDHDYIRRAAKIGKFGVLREVKISISLRRFNQDGWMKVLLIYLLAEIHYHLLGPVKSNIFNYKFGHYAKDKSIN